MTVDEANDRVVKPASFDYFYEETLQLVVDTELSGTCPRTLGTIIIHNIHYKPNFCIQFGVWSEKIKLSYSLTDLDQINLVQCHVGILQ